MAVSDLPAVGLRIRQERLRRGISLRALARDVGVSASMISQIETGKSQPSVSTLYAITSALRMSIEDVFSPAGRLDEADEPAEAAAPPVDLARPGPVEPLVQSLGRHAGAAVGALLAAPGAAGPARSAAPTENGAGGSDAPAGAHSPVPADGRLGPLVRPADRQVLRLDSGVTWERLGELRDRTVDFLLITYAPGATSSSRSELMRHSGAEYGYLLRGELVLTLGFEEVHLRQGDAISFDSTTPHGYRNDGTEPAVGVWFVIEE
jgi:transcriptional regulator with XRE-family HTH domain/quercetin dioxygenase-like cupin family protein